VDQHLLDQINACFRDVHAFIFTGLIGRLDRDGILSKNAAAAWLKATAAQCEEWRSDQQVSDMLRDLADTIIDPEAAPRWTPRVIECGKTD
jgi:hypothetical protein